MNQANQVHKAKRRTGRAIPKGEKGDPAVIEAGSIVNEMLGEKSVRSKNIGTGSIMLEHLNSEVKDILAYLQNKLMN